MQKYPLIDLFIAGAQKSFTTSLKEYFGEHPSVTAHPQQEMAYFTDDKEYSLGYEKAISHYYWDIEHHAGNKIVAKNATLYLSEEGIKRLHDHNPACKILLSLRNPVDRAYSSYLMENNYKDMEFPFEKIKEVAAKSDISYWPFKFIIDAGNYAKHLKVIYNYFPKDQVMVILSKEIREDPLKICREMFQWLGVDDTFIPVIKVHNPTTKRRSRIYARFANTVLQKNSLAQKYARLIVPSYYKHKIGDFIRKMNKTKEKYSDMDSATRQYLLAYYHEANKELEAMTGKGVTTIWNK